MVESSFYFREHQKVKIDIDGIFSKGGPENPMLIIPLSFELNAISRDIESKRFLFHAIEGQIKFNDSPNAINSNVKIHSITIFNKETYKLDVEFQLNSYQIEKIEQSRKGNCKCHLDLIVHIGAYKTLSFPNNEQSISFLSDFQRTGVQGMDFEIQQSLWGSKILSGLGYRSFKFIELPESSNLIPEEYEISIKELEQAQTYFLQGDYDKVVAHCRSAIDPLKSKFIALKDHVISKSEFEWMNEMNDKTLILLDLLTRKTSHFTSKSHHAPSFGHFSRFEAEVVTMMTTAIVAFAGKVLNLKE